MATICTLLSQIDLRRVRVSVGEVEYPPAGGLGPRWQHDVELVLLHAGSARIAIDDDPPFLLLPGYVALLLPGHRELFEFDAREDTHHSWVQLKVEDPLPGEVALAPRMLPASDALTELVHGAVSAARAPLATGEQLAASLAAAAIWRYVGEAGSRAERQHDAVGLARSYLNLHLGDADVNLERLAAAAHVTPAHLVRRFRAELGTTPMAYFWLRRVDAGVALLTSTGLPVGEIARRVGFRSVYHFSRRVKQATGLPPTGLRRRGWSQTGGRSNRRPPPSPS
jgi:AraC-like DNA-binding protein